MGIETRLRGGLHTVCFLMCCAVALAGTGCWLAPALPADSGAMSVDEPDAGRPLDPADDPAGSFFNEPFDQPLEPAEEEPIRPVGEPDGELDKADLTDDGVIDRGDIDAFSALFGTSKDSDGFNPAADFDGDGAVTLVDFQIFLELIAQAEGE